MTEREKMLAGELYDGGDPELMARWHRANLHTLAEIEAADKPRRKAAAPAMQDQPNPPGEADRRVREDLERMREFMRKQNSQEGK